MNLKFILNVLGLILLTSSVFTKKIDDCNNIIDYLQKKYDTESTFDAVINECETDDQGNVIKLKVFNYELQEEEVNKILSYTTIKDLFYYVRFNTIDDPENPYQSITAEHPGYSKFPTAITNLTELETLTFKYEDMHSANYRTIMKNTSIEPGSLKLSKKLKKLYFSQIDFNSQNMDELSTLTNIESIKFEYCSFDEVGLDPLKNIESLEILKINESGIPNNFTKIKSLKNLDLYEISCDSSNILDFNDLENLEILYVSIINKCKFDASKLEKLSELYIYGVEPEYNEGINASVTLKAPNNLKKLYLNYLKMSSDNYKVAASLPNLEELSILHYSVSDNFDVKSLESHDKLTKLTIACSPRCFTKIDINLEILNDLNNLIYLDLSGNRIEKFPKQIPSLKKLEYIDLQNNAISDTIPESYNNLENLKYFNVMLNKSIGGKVLKNKSLEECSYGYPDETENLCIPKDYEQNCLIGNEYKTCVDNSNDPTSSTIIATPTENTEITNPITTVASTTTSEPTTTTTTNGKCGEGIGSCPSGQCCSKYGWCGKSYKYCAVSEGCQSKFGICSNTSVEGKCGEDYGKCPSGQCCSKYGWCGKTDDYCGSGCQSEFGDCKNKTTKGKCGESYGKCPSGQCCSKYGWCGKTDDYCGSGCQSEFGNCNNKTVKGKCGEGYGKCPSDQCCSRYGWCGKTDDYCGKGCQSEFGKCK